MKRSNWVWIYKMGRFAEERRAFLCDLNEQGHSMQTLRNVNRILLAVAEQVDVRRSTDISEVQIVRAAGSWAAKSCAPHSKAETLEAAAKRFVYIAKNWLRFLGKWRDPERNPQFRAELESFLKQLRDERGYTDQTLSTRESALTLFFEWLGKRDIPLKEVSPQTLAAYFLENKTRGWKKATIKVYAQSLRVFFRYAEQHNWCVPGLAKTIESPRIYSMSGLPEGPSWEQVRRLIASLNSDRPGHIRDRAIILLFLYPDHKSIAEFRRMHHDAVTAAGAELVPFARSCGLIRGEWIAIDGSKFCAVASIDSARERLALQRYLDSIEKADEEQQQA
jgi:integrase/recombinase XerD